jgi:glycosyltransferase involved in cell wall biosynthesis
MIRVGFLLANSASWTGGLVYLRNLIATVMALPDRRIEPVLIASIDARPDDLEGFGDVEVLRTSLAGPGLSVKLARRASERLLGRDLLLEGFLRRHRIAALSHSGYLGPRSPIPAIAWLPDFQHLRMPEFFSEAEVAARNRGYARVAQGAQRVLLSSEDAKRDLSRFVPGAIAKSRVLRFTATMVRGDDTRGRDFLAAAYGINDPYFYLPNQFWKHKNHRLVVDALGILARTGKAPLVVTTGKTEDRRNPDYFDDLMQHAEAIGAAPFFKVLGLVPYADLSVLAYHAVALINPSAFEGWSTTVEEAKSLGKTILLSDIPVHREQAPARATFVKPGEPQAMADAMLAVLANWSAEEDARAMAQAVAALPGRRQAFGEAYQAIVLEAVSRF